MKRKNISLSPLIVIDNSKCVVLSESFWRKILIFLFVFFNNKWKSIKIVWFDVSLTEFYCSRNNKSAIELNYYSMGMRKLFVGSRLTKKKKGKRKIRYCIDWTSRPIPRVHFTASVQMHVRMYDLIWTQVFSIPHYFPHFITPLHFISFFFLLFLFSSFYIFCVINCLLMLTRTESNVSFFCFYFLCLGMRCNVCMSTYFIRWTKQLEFN